jgi:hypothetical protein
VLRLCIYGSILSQVGNALELKKARTHGIQCNRIFSNEKPPVFGNISSIKMMGSTTPELCSNQAKDIESSLSLDDGFAPNGCERGAGVDMVEPWSPGEHNVVLDAASNT